MGEERRGRGSREKEEEGGDLGMEEEEGLGVEGVGMEEEGWGGKPRARAQGCKLSHREARGDGGEAEGGTQDCSSRTRKGCESTLCRQIWDGKGGGHVHAAGSHDGGGNLQFL